MRHDPGMELRDSALMPGGERLALGSLRTPDMMVTVETPESFIRSISVFGVERETMLRVLSLGAGVQSSTLALMSARGDLPKFDAAIFADTGWESERVYSWLDWLEKQLPFPVVRVKRDGPDLGKLWLDVARGERSREGASLPGMFLTGGGMSPFQCSKEFKTRVVLKEIRRMLGLSPGERAKFDGIEVEQFIGMDYAEMDRMKDSEARFVKNVYPLVDIRMRRRDCITWMEERQYPRPPRSSCVFCPFRSDAEWWNLQQESPADFSRAVWFDTQIRAGWKGMEGQAFLHRTLRPLDQIDFAPPPDLFSIVDAARTGDWGFKQDCEGACGT